MAAYAAGLIDGEGCISIDKSLTARIDVGMSEAGLACLRILERWFGGKIDKGRDATDKWAATFRWRLIGTATVPVLEALLPYLQLKWEQARLALNVQALRDEMPLGKQKRPVWTPELRKRGERMRSELMRLNQKGPAELEWPADSIARLVDGEWVTPQLSMFDDLGYAPFSGTWPRAGRMSGGTIFQRPALVPLTAATGSGLLPTPAATEYGTNQGGAAGRTGPVRPSLSTMARKGMWPTPHGFAKEEYERRQGPSGNELGRAVFQAEREKLMPTPTAQDAHSSRNKTANRSEGQAHHSGETLTDFVDPGEGDLTLLEAVDEQPEMWPTPRASPNENRQINASPSHLEGRHGMPLAAAVQMWPTPTARDYKDTGDLRCVPENGLLPRVVQRVENEQKMWPTPRSKDGNGAGVHGDGGLDLHTAVEIAEGAWTPDGETDSRQGSYSTFPTTGSNRDNAGGSGARRKAKEDGTYISGKLNPAWVSVLMGLPPAWTDLEDE